MKAIRDVLREAEWFGADMPEEIWEGSVVTIEIEVKPKSDYLERGLKAMEWRRDMDRVWTGGRRSLLQYLDEQGIVPTRDAEAALSTIAESSGFRERG